MAHAENPYRAAAAVLLRESGCTVRRYRSDLRGVAWTGTSEWEIEAPEPTTPLRFGIFAHEVGHQLLHRHGSKPRWLEEWEAWDYALRQFDRFDLPGAEQAVTRAAKSLRYAARKAGRRATPATIAAIRDRYPPWVWEES